MHHNVRHTGEVCEIAGWYVFVAYYGRGSSVLPTAGEWMIHLDVGDRVPPVRSTNCAVERRLVI